MMLKNACVLLVAISGVAAQTCGPPGSIVIAGSTVVEPVARKWAEEYTKKCTSITVTVQGGGSSLGASRVCSAGTGNNTAVDIGNMSRKWRLNTEVNTTAIPHEFQCFIGDKSRKTAQIEVALDGIATVVRSGGLVAQCLDKVPGLTTAQLRWMFSNQTEAFMGLTTDALLRDVIPNTDNNATSKNWREISTGCPPINIRIAGTDSLSGTQEFFREVVGFRTGESFDIARPGGFFNAVKEEDIVKYVVTSSLENPGDAIGFVGMSTYFDNGAVLYGIPIKNAVGVYAAPTKANIESDVYNPLGRRIYMQVLLTDSSLANTKPFIAWGLSNQGALLIPLPRSLPLPLDQRVAMLARLGLPAPNDPLTLRPIAPVAPVRPPSFAPIAPIAYVPPRTAAPVSISVTNLQCGPPGSIVIAGSTFVEPVARKWAEEYTKKCTSITVTVQGGGSSLGASRVCSAGTGNNTAVDIGNMSRKWRLNTEVNTTAIPHEFQCFIGDKSRKTAQIEVALDGIATVVRSGGLVAQCLANVPGLTTAQLRWMFSNASEVLMGLTTDALLREVIPNSDNNATSKNWREISAECPPINIRIAGTDSLSGTQEFFREAVGFRTGESFDIARPGGFFNAVKEEDIVKYVVTSSLENPGDAIGFVSMATYFDNASVLYGVPIKNTAGVYAAPTKANIESDVYNPFGRRLYMQVLLTDTSLANTKPFMAWGLSNQGALLTCLTRYLPLPLDQRVMMLQRLGLPGPSDPTAPCSSSGSVTRSPTRAPAASVPTKVPTKQPVATSTKAPTKQPVSTTTKAPTKLPVATSTKAPTKQPVSTTTKAPTKQPVKTSMPVVAPVRLPTLAPVSRRKRCGFLRRLFKRC